MSELPLIYGLCFYEKKGYRYDYQADNNIPDIPKNPFVGAQKVTYSSQRSYPYYRSDNIIDHVFFIIHLNHASNDRCKIAY